MKSKQTKALKLLEKFEDCQEEWGLDEEEEDKTHPSMYPLITRNMKWKRGRLSFKNPTEKRL